MDWQTVGLIAGGAAVLGGAAVAYGKGKIFNTHRLLTKYRKHGFETEAVEDSTGRTCWDVWYRRINHNWTTGINEVSREYLGKIERYGNIDINNSSPILGQPFFYVTPDPWRKTWAETQEAIELARGVGAQIKYQG